MYSFAEADGHRDDPSISSFGILFLFWQGVIQGCPLSACTFVLCMDPFLRAFAEAIDSRGRGVTRARADDVGIYIFDRSTS